MPFKNISHREMISKSAAMAETLTPEMYAYLMSLLPTPQIHAQLHERLTASYAASLNGDPETVKECEANRAALEKCLTVMIGMAKLLSINDPSVPEKLGIHRLKKTTPASKAVLIAPRDFKVFYTPIGKFVASIKKVAGAKGYQIWACDGDPGVQTNWRIVTASASCKRIALPELNRSTPTWLKIRAMRGKSSGPWSHCIELPPFRSH